MLTQVQMVAPPRNRFNLGRPQVLISAGPRNQPRGFKTKPGLAAGFYVCPKGIASPRDQYLAKIEAAPHKLK